MSTSPQPDLAAKEKWGSKIGVILAVAGSAVGLGNFLRFPGQAVNNGGGAFMIPYIISFVLLGIPIAWCEWTMGRLGGRFGQNSAPGIMFALWRRWPAKGLGAMTLLIPVVIYMYYVLLEAWCLDYCIEFAKGGFAEMFAKITTASSDHTAEVQAVVEATDAHWETTSGGSEHGILLREGGRTIWLVSICFLVNFYIIYHGVTRGIEVFCKWAMPLLVLCAVIILLRVLTLPNISSGLGFMWNPQWEQLKNPQVWLAAAGQIFFSLSVGFGLILCYSSYLRSNDDVVLTSLSASSANEFCEVILAGLIVVPTAFLFLGAENATKGLFGLGFVTIPAIMHFMPLGNFFGAMWFGLLFLAAVTSSLSMLQPAIAFLEDAFALRRWVSIAILGIITAGGATLTMYFSKNTLALDYTDFWCNLMMIIAATFQVLIFGWVIGAARGVKEMNRGADLHVPRFVAFVIRFITPTFLIVILVMWGYHNLPDYIRGMNPARQGIVAERAVYAQAIEENYTDTGLDAEVLASKVEELLGPEEDQPVNVAELPAWLQQHQETAEEDRRAAAADANIARFVFMGIIGFYIMLVVLSDIACRNRIGRMIDQWEDSGAGWETSP